MLEMPLNFSTTLKCQLDTSRSIREMTEKFPRMANPLQDDQFNPQRTSVFVQLMSRLTKPPTELQEISDGLISTLSDASTRIENVTNRVLAYEQGFDGEIIFTF